MESVCLVCYNEYGILINAFDIEDIDYVTHGDQEIVVFFKPDKPCDTKYGIELLSYINEEDGSKVEFFKSLACDKACIMRLNLDNS